MNKTNQLKPAKLDVIVYKLPDASQRSMLGPHSWLASGKQFVAYLLLDPKIRADGTTEEDAINRLSKVVYDRIEGKETAKHVTIDLNELFVKQIMEE